MINDLVFIDPFEEPVCPECKGTGKVTLFTGVVDCKMCKSKPADHIVYNYDKKTRVAGIAARRILPGEPQ